MPTNTGYKVNYKFIPGDLSGPRLRQDPNVGPPAHGNYFLRNWGTRDKFRAALGTYWWDMGDGTDINELYYAGATRTLTQDDQDPSRYGQVGVGGVTVGSAGTHSDPAFTVKIEDVERNLGPHGARFVINPNRTTWNDNNINNTMDALIQEEAESMGVNASGNPNWPAFIMGTEDWFDWGEVPGMQGSITPPNFPGAVPAAENDPFRDYATSYYGLSDNLDDRLESGTNLEIEAVYNFYADTTPPYEKISKEASEPMLTNYYCFQSLLRTSNDNKDVNLGSDGLPVGNSDPAAQFAAEEYFAQVTLADALQSPATAGDPLFENLNPNSAAPPAFSVSQTRRFYELYSKGIATLRDTALLDPIKQVFSEKYKNMVIVSSDVKALTQLVVSDEDTSGLKHLPFYNKIRIPYDGDAVKTTSGVMNSSYLTRIRDEMNTVGGPGEVSARLGDKFIDILQLYVASKISNPVASSTGTSIVGAAGSTTSTAMPMVTQSPAPTTINVNIVQDQSLSTAGTTTPTGTPNMPVQKVISFPDFIAECRNWQQQALATGSGLNTGFLGTILKRLDPVDPNTPVGDTIADSVPDNYILLRDYNGGVLNSYATAIIEFLARLDNDNLPAPAPGRPKGFPTRSARQLILQPTHAPNETLMYEMKKRLLNPNGTPGTTVQTILIGKDFGGSGATGAAPGDVTYIDTQVKYGVRYYYEINAIKIIYGNEYCYRDLSVKTDGATLIPMRAAGTTAVYSALGFFNNQIVRNFDDLGRISLDANIDTEASEYFEYTYGIGMLHGDAGAHGHSNTGPDDRSTWGTGHDGSVFGYYVFTDPSISVAASQGTVDSSGNVVLLDTDGPDGAPGQDPGNTWPVGSKEHVLTDLANNGTNAYISALGSGVVRDKLSQLKLEVKSSQMVPDNDGIGMNDIGGVLSRNVVPMPQAPAAQQWTPLQLLIMGGSSGAGGAAPASSGAPNSAFTPPEDE